MIVQKLTEREDLSLSELLKFVPDFNVPRACAINPYQCEEPAFVEV